MQSSLHNYLVAVILATLSFASPLPANEVGASGQEGSATQPAKPRSQRRAERRERRRIDSNRAIRELTAEVQSLRAEVRLLRERLDQLEGKRRSPAAASTGNKTPSPVIELKWAASEHIPGFTRHENRGGYVEDTFYSKEPVLTLKPEFVHSVKYASGTFPPSGDRISHWVHVRLNEQAIALLENEIAKLKQDGAKWGKVKYVTLLVDGEEGGSATLRPGKMDEHGFSTPNWTTAEKARRVVESLKAADGTAGLQGGIPSGVRFERPPLEAFKPEAREALRKGASYLDRVSNIPFNHRSWVDPSDVMAPASLVRKKPAE